MFANKWRVDTYLAGSFAACAGEVAFMCIYLAGISSLEFRNLQTSSRSDPRLPRKQYAAAPITMAKKGPLQPASQRLLNPRRLQAAQQGAATRWLQNPKESCAAELPAASLFRNTE